MAAREATARHWAEYAVVWAAFQLLRRTPLAVARGLAALLGRLAQALTPKWRRIALENLGQAFPEISLDERRRIVAGVYQNLARNVLALARLPTLDPDNIGEWVDYDGLEHYERAIDAGRGALFLTAHLGGWELSSAAHALFGHPMWVMARTLENPLLDPLINGRRELFGNRVIRKRDAARATLKALRNNEAVGILADQNTIGADGVFVEFFGRPASSTKSVAQLARQTGAAVIFGFAYWMPESKSWRLRFRPLEMVETGDREADLVENTQRCQTAIEAAVREFPDQWLWIHQRWRHRPATPTD